MISIFTEERQQEILRILNSDGSVNANDLVALFEVSKETIRRDLNTLEKKGFLSRTHGGAVLHTDMLPEVPALPKPVTDSTGRIARIAASKIQSRDTVFLDSSDFCLQMLDFLPDNMQITAITNSITLLEHASVLGRKNLSLICLAGLFNSSTKMLTGSQTLQSLEAFFPDKAFFSCSGISLTRHLTEYSLDEVDIKRAVIQKSKQNYLLASPESIGVDGSFLFSAFDQIDYLITSPSDLNPEKRKLLQELRNRHPKPFVLT